LTNFSFNGKDGGAAELTLEGMVYLGDSNKELETVNKFLSGLKADAEFNKYFKYPVEVAKRNKYIEL